MRPVKRKSRTAEQLVRRLGRMLREAIQLRSEIAALRAHRDELVGLEGRVIPHGLTMAQAQREIARQVLQECGGNRTAAARVLGVSRRVMYAWLPAEVQRDVPGVGVALPGVDPAAQPADAGTYKERKERKL